MKKDKKDIQVLNIDIYGSIIEEKKNYMIDLKYAKNEVLDDINSHILELKKLRKNIKGIKKTIRIEKKALRLQRRKLNRINRSLYLNMEDITRINGLFSLDVEQSIDLNKYFTKKKFND